MDSGCELMRVAGDEWDFLLLGVGVGESAGAARESGAGIDILISKYSDHTEHSLVRALF